MLSPRISDYVVLSASIRMHWLRPSERRELWRRVRGLKDDQAAGAFIEQTEAIVKTIRALMRPTRALTKAIRDSLMRVP